MDNETEIHILWNADSSSNDTTNADLKYKYTYMEKDKKKETPDNWTRKEKVDLLFRTIGLLSIIIAALALNFTMNNSKKEERKQMVARHKQDSISSAEEIIRQENSRRQDSFQKENDRKTAIEWTFKQQQWAHTLHQEEIAFREKQLTEQRSFNNLLSGIERQAQGNLKREKAIFELDLYSYIVPELEKLANNEIENPAYNAACLKIQYEIRPKVDFAGNNILLSYIDKFLLLNGDFEKLNNVYHRLDSFENELIRKIVVPDSVISEYNKPGPYPLLNSQLIMITYSTPQPKKRPFEYKESIFWDLDTPSQDFINQQKSSLSLSENGIHEEISSIIELMDSAYLFCSPKRYASVQIEHENQQPVALKNTPTSKRSKKQMAGLSLDERVIIAYGITTRRYPKEILTKEKIDVKHHELCIQVTFDRKKLHLEFLQLKERMNITLAHRASALNNVSKSITKLMQQNKVLEVE